ncbi:hypothetical protein Bca52824_001293 [Brassica carinata]|uniref:Uncharacterized protein n=1 Tax=Brassica carinata TaxID=52824 RepID=A0A8X8BD77_BRACI|nr:hypothetical protein Bca52824_001293 [Brassica carinata]
MPPQIIEPIEDIGLARVDEDMGTPLETPSDSACLDRRLSRRFAPFRSPRSKQDHPSARQFSRMRKEAYSKIYGRTPSRGSDVSSNRGLYQTCVIDPTSQDGIEPKRDRNDRRGPWTDARSHLRRCRAQVGAAGARSFLGLVPAPGWCRRRQASPLPAGVRRARPVPRQASLVPAVRRASSCSRDVRAPGRKPGARASPLPAAPGARLVPAPGRCRWRYCVGPAASPAKFAAGARASPSPVFGNSPLPRYAGARLEPLAPASLRPGRRQYWYAPGQFASAYGRQVGAACQPAQGPAVGARPSCRLLVCSIFPRRLFGKSFEVLGGSQYGFQGTKMPPLPEIMRRQMDGRQDFAAGARWEWTSLRRAHAGRWLFGARTPGIAARWTLVGSCRAALAWRRARWTLAGSSAMLAYAGRTLDAGWLGAGRTRLAPGASLDAGWFTGGTLDAGCLAPRTCPCCVICHAGRLRRAWHLYWRVIATGRFAANSPAPGARHAGRLCRAAFAHTAHPSLFQVCFLVYGFVILVLGFRSAIKLVIVVRSLNSDRYLDMGNSQAGTPPRVLEPVHQAAVKLFASAPTTLLLLIKLVQSLHHGISFSVLWEPSETKLPVTSLNSVVSLLITPSHHASATASNREVSSFVSTELLFHRHESNSSPSLHLETSFSGGEIKLSDRNSGLSTVAHSRTSSIHVANQSQAPLVVSYHGIRPCSLSKLPISLGHLQAAAIVVKLRRQSGKKRSREIQWRLLLIFKTGP